MIIQDWHKTTERWVRLPPEDQEGSGRIRKHQEGVGRTELFCCGAMPIVSRCTDCSPMSVV